MKVLSDTSKLSLTTIISIRTTNFFRRLHAAKLWHHTAKWSWHFLSDFCLRARLVMINSFSRKQIYLTIGKQRYTRICTSNLNVALQLRRTVATLFQELTQTSIFFLSGKSGHKQQTSLSKTPWPSPRTWKQTLITLFSKAHLGLSEIVTARFTNSGEIMLILGLVEVGFSLSLEPQ